MLVAAVELGDEVSIASDRFGRCSLDSSRGVATATSRSVIGWLSFWQSSSLSVSGQTSYTADLAVPPVGLVGATRNRVGAATVQGSWSCRGVRSSSPWFS